VKETQPEQLYAYNPTYGFSLTRKSNEHPWVVQSIDRRHEGETNPEVEKMVEVSGHLHSLTYACMEDLQNLLKQPTFRVLTATSINKEGAELIQIDFENPHPLSEPDKPFSPTQSGTLVLDPNRYWCVLSYNLKGKYANAEATLKGETEFREPSPGYPIPKRCVETNDQMRTDGEHLVLVTASDYDLHEPNHAARDEDFTLSAFGLPEPFDVQPRPRWYLWAGASGVICLVLGSIFFWLKRRPSGTTPRL
jgi:hypothetical protein